MEKTKSRQIDGSGCQKEKQNLRNDKQADPILSLPVSAESCWVVVRVGEQWDEQPVRRMEAGARGIDLGFGALLRVCVRGRTPPALKTRSWIRWNLTASQAESRQPKEVKRGCRLQAGRGQEREESSGRFDGRPGVPSSVHSAPPIVHDVPMCCCPCPCPLELGCTVCQSPACGKEPLFDL